MKKLSVRLENCYGIGFLEKEFDFSKCTANLIYAPNGVMKTSLAKTFRQISQGNKPEEKIHGKIPTYDIMFDGIVIKHENILVVEPFNASFESKNISTLLIHKEKKDRYDQICEGIVKSNKKLIIKLNKLSGIKKDDVEKQLISDFSCSNIYEAIKILKSESEVNTILSNIRYIEIFNDKVQELLNNPDVKNSIFQYIDKYNELIEQSSLFVKGIFNPVKANGVLLSLKKERFFDASHKITLNGIDGFIENSEKLEKVIEDAKQSILNDENLKLISKKIISGVAEIKSFQELIENYPEISTDLGNLQNLKKKIWYSYFYSSEPDFLELETLFEESKEELKSIEEEASLEETQWFEAQRIFKERFDVPFSIEIENEVNSILGTNAPNIIFSFKDDDGNEKRYNRGKLNSLDTLSVGEKRALYLLYVIFEFKARIENGSPTLVIIDDIADSFDYKNKYAIIEYLKEMAEENLLRLLVMTHNFDFYRTFQSRILGKSQWDNSFVAYKSEGKIEFFNGGSKNVSNPFEKWKSEFGKNHAMLVSIIPFARNLVDYSSGTECTEYQKLTSMLHIKLDTHSLKVSDLEIIISSCINNTTLDSSFDKAKLVINHIYETADNVCVEVSEGEIRLENKICLSIAIRLKAEEYMWSQVINKSPIKGSQTGLLFDRFVKEQNPITPEFIIIKKVLSQVILMTPENIHINSFMYEPLMDISINHLISLYSSVKNL